MPRLKQLRANYRDMTLSTWHRQMAGKFATPLSSLPLLKWYMIGLQHSVQTMDIMPRKDFIVISQFVATIKLG